MNYVRRLIFCIYFGFTSIASTTMAMVLFDATTEQPVGSAVPFCWSLMQDRHYFLTAHHATKDVSKLTAGQIYDLEPVQSWPALDLAIYSAKPGEFFVAIPCEEFALKLEVPAIKTLAELKDQREVLIQLHGFDSETKKNSAKKVRTRVGIIEVGRKGYAKIPLMVIDTPSGPGLSGGLISADVDGQSGLIASESFEDWRAARSEGFYREAIGIVIGRSKDGQRTYAISAIQFRLLTGQFPGFDQIRTKADVERLKVVVENLKNLTRVGGTPEDILGSGTGRLVE